MFLIQWLQRKHKEFPSTYLYLLGNFPIFTAQKMKFLIKDLFSKCDQIRSFLQIRSHLLKKYFMENFIFCVVFAPKASSAFGNFPNFLAIDSQQLSDVLGKWLKEV